MRAIKDQEEAFGFHFQERLKAKIFKFLQFEMVKRKRETVVS